MQLTEEIVELTKELVKIPSYENEVEIARFVYKKMQQFGMSPEIIGDKYHPSIVCNIIKDATYKTVWIESTLDTVPPGNISNWKTDPLIASVIGNKMYGLGIADSKIALAMYCILTRELSKGKSFKGNFFIGFDAQEQNGKFTGIRDVVKIAPKADICILGYQGIDEIHIGARGWLRFKITTSGVVAHTGSRSKKGINSIHSMNKAMSKILDNDLNTKTQPFFEFGSSMNISQINGGTAINIVPDKCEVYIDIRLIPGQNAKDIAKEFIDKLDAISREDSQFKYELEVLQFEQAYLTNPSNNFVKLLQKNASKILKKDITLHASGPGSVGNVINKLGVPIINSFGVDSDNVHSPNEWINLDSIEKVYKILKDTIEEFV